MEREKFLRIYFKNEVRTVAEKAEFVYEKQKRLSEVLNKTEWIMGSDVSRVDINDKELICAKLLKSMKSSVRRIFMIRKVDDDYCGDCGGWDSFYFSRKLDDDSHVTYEIYTKGMSRYNSYAFIYKYELMPQMQKWESAKDFIEKLIEIFSPITLEMVDVRPFTDEEEMSNKYLSGWMTYFDESFDLPELPEWAKVETMLGGGHLIITTEEDFDPENEEHKKRARTLLPLLQLKKK